MCRKLIAALVLLLSAKAWALSCSTPITISDPMCYSAYANVFANETGDAALVWLSINRLSEEEPEAVEVSYKKHDSSWSFPEIISGWGKFWGYSCFINSDGGLFATWKTDFDKYIHIAEKKEGKPWNFSLEWLSPGFRYASAHFEPSSGKLIFVSNHLDKEKSPDIVLATKLPGQVERYLESFKIEEGVSRISDLSIQTNKNGIAYAIVWVNKEGENKRLMSRRIQDNRFIGDPEVICHLQDYSQYETLQVNLDENGDITIFYVDEKYNGKIVSRINGQWSEPLLIATEKEEPSQAQLFVDSKGNKMAIWTIKIDDKNSIKAMYKPFEKPWMDPVLLFYSNEEVFCEMSSDNNGSFVVVWEKEGCNNRTIFGTAFSTVTQTWSEPRLLSPEGEDCYNYSFAFGAPGKGYISWEMGLNERAVIQIAELSN